MVNHDKGMSRPRRNIPRREWQCRLAHPANNRVEPDSGNPLRHHPWPHTDRHPCEMEAL
ncbi:hypothetical protein BISU_3028 [Bifidobacterium subtile]|uniref:Uncharacterized protein n=1 Tax=Bifidobacterium subtile TaxID=77635 RepID=A0A087E555_9BIFI|nr:hypothetical protein BISU_3028 [Bifidobacterium subtile]